MSRRMGRAAADRKVRETAVGAPLPTTHPTSPAGRAAGPTTASRASRLLPPMHNRNQPRPAALQDFFTRKLMAGARPIKDPQDPSVAVLPADCRAVVYPSVQEATRLWWGGGGGLTGG
jgi:hypothetical protein